MRLHRLELAGFGPFRERQVVDFDAFAADGVFLIAGRTGAGKSSILDGVCFALYGTVPRYEHGDRRLRSDHCDLDDVSEVRLEFTVDDTRWRVTRAPEYQRPARRGGGLTPEPARVEVEELVDGVWVGRAARLREAGILLDEVLGLNAQQFQQVILLAQNRFSRFLLARNDERQALLRTLFGTLRFEEYERALQERHRDAQRSVDRAVEHASTLLELAERLIDEHGLTGPGEERPVDPASRRETAEQARSRAAYRVEVRANDRATADAAYTAAAEQHRLALAAAKARADLDAARTALAELEAAAPRIDDDRVRLERARAAEALRATLDAADRAERAHADARAGAETARRAWSLVAAEAERLGVPVAGAADGPVAGAAGGSAGRAGKARGPGSRDKPAGDLVTVVDRLTGDLAVWAVTAAQEADLVADERRLGEAEERIAVLSAELAGLDAQRARVPAERARIESLLETARDGAARFDAARAGCDEFAARLDAARDAERLAADLVAADAAHADAAATAAAAMAAIAALLQRRLAGFAGELAAGLVDGEPCAVCGATAHPHPAPAAADAVTDDDLAAAEAARDRAVDAERRAAETSRAVRERHAEAAARAGGREVAVLETELAGAVEARRAAEQAASERDELTARLAELATLDENARVLREDVAARLSDARETAAALAATVSAAGAEVAAARGPYETVAARIAAATAVRDAARACVAADEAAAERARAQRDAETALQRLVAASDFADAADAAAALLDEPERTAREERLADHVARLEATRARLLQLELETAGEPTDPVDVASAAAQLAAADAARTAAIAAESDARHVAELLRDLLAQADSAYASVAGEAEEAAVVTRLADTVAGRAPNTMKMNLESFVLAAELEEIVAAANLRLAEMSSGRYTLHHSDARAARGAASGLGIVVLDAHTGRLRSPQSLSGGETFLASLALALGLAEVVTSRAGGLRLDTLFVDEGFGSLDPETLDLAMRTLDELRAGGRTVGIISHVEAMKEQLPAQLAVEALPEGPSVIRQR
ncbi:AAA family ATPase [Microbacterium sp.]|uniref:AAA family ATPase n=1 Tax=Microbacterium sp. TaxID=51671 RepID=UPI0039E62EBE